ncbi:DUF3961 domain-containing protein [Bacillus cytotoxicus]|nr:MULTISPECIES: DUF3961 domain-containing protein [unclassified Bacillus cereus group]
MNRVNDYFGLESKSDCIWVYGFFSISTVLFLIDIIIAFI